MPKNANVMAHQGRPLEVLEQLLAMPELPTRNISPCSASGPHLWQLVVEEMAGPD